MSPLTISLIAFAIIFGGAVIGMIAPHARLSTDAKDVVRLSMGLIGTIAALVLGLLIASAKSSYDAKSTKLKEITAGVILIDTLLEQYGEEALPARRQLRTIIDPMIERIWIEENSSQQKAFEGTPQGRAFYRSIEALPLKDDVHRSMQARALTIVTDIAQARLALFTQAGNSVPLPFLAVLVFWLAMIFASFGLFVRSEPVVIVALFVCSLSAAGAIFLILELGQPFSGIMAISSAPLRHALPPL